MQRYLGIDVGAETIKLAELRREGGGLLWTRRRIEEHHKDPGPTLLKMLAEWDWGSVRGAAVSGRLRAQVRLPHVPTKQAQALAWSRLFGDGPGTVVSIGSHGFSVLELRGSGNDVFRENSRCSQGTGNFLRQLIERFDLDLESASALCADVADPAPLSGRCPVILKTDMTHLANKGESRARILAGLFDAVCANVQVLLKPAVCPPRLALIGGVARSRRIRESFGRFAARHQLELCETEGDDALFFEALGAAVFAAGQEVHVPLESLLDTAGAAELERTPPLAASLGRVKRMPVPLRPAVDAPREVVLGFDIGSTGSKAVALDLGTRQVLWEGYLSTNGQPVTAAQELMRRFTQGSAGHCPVRAAGATGSGREIVGSLMASCYGAERVFVLNEIAAHAQGALHFDPRVDTIFEIGGQDAKYIRLAGGRVVDAAMNEACSAGTGSFIEEQGRKFAGIDSVAELGREALRARHGISLGQHCSVFMAEVIDQAVAAGEERAAIVAGIYDSIVQNYLNRVKGCRSVGQVIFCQGMPFSADALAAAVARQTGSEVVIPPNPGTVGALGIALLAAERQPPAGALDPKRFLEARVERKDTFVCNSTQGCGGAGNKCRIDRLTTVVAGERARFTWGGGCSLYDKATRRQKLPDRAPDPFREREQLVSELVRTLGSNPHGPTVAVSDEFSLKNLFPFFAVFLRELGFALKVHNGADHRALERGIEGGNVPFCAPMQQYRGLVAQMLEGEPDFLFLPMLREVTRVKDEKHSVLCPIVQASPDMLRWDLGGAGGRTRMITTLVDAGPGNLESAQFKDSCARIARDFGLEGDRWRAAYQAGLEAQRGFEAQCLAIGRRALDFCAERGVTPVVVLGRSYTLYNPVLNSNVPAILREQGAIAVPVDCYPVGEEVPVFGSMYWSYSQQNLRAAHQVRRTPGTYALYCSNYSCGPDSFTLHFFAYLMEGKPFAVIETDGHAGDAGTKTRVEAFLHCVRQDQGGAAAERSARALEEVERRKQSARDLFRSRQTMLIPRMGPGAEMLAAAFRGIGVDAECLPMADREALRLGRRHTSGKECVPMTISLGCFLARLERERDPERRFAILMPSSYGPCRFGAYHLLHSVILERLGLAERVSVISPDFSSYYDGIPDGFAALVFAALNAVDLLTEALYDARPVERLPGAADAIYARAFAELLELVEDAGRRDLSAAGAVMQIAGGRLFGISELLERTAAELASIREPRELPTVMLVGEIYVRCDPFANDFVVEKLERRGIRVRFAPFTEWLEYADYINFKNGERSGFGSHLSSLLRGVIQELCWARMAGRLGWPKRLSVPESLAAAAPYLREEFQGESVLTVGGPLHAWREGHIDGVVSVGPLECMPNKIAESQFFHVAEREGLPSLTLSLNGEPLPPEALDNFAFALHARFRDRREEVSRASRASGAAVPSRRSALGEMGMMAAQQAVRFAHWATTPLRARGAGGSD